MNYLVRKAANTAAEELNIAFPNNPEVVIYDLEGNISDQEIIGTIVSDIESRFLSYYALKEFYCEYPLFGNSIESFNLYFTIVDHNGSDIIISFECWKK